MVVGRRVVVAVVDLGMKTSQMVKLYLCAEAAAAEVSFALDSQQLSRLNSRQAAQAEGHNKFVHSHRRSHSEMRLSEDQFLSKEFRLAPELPVILAPSVVTWG